MQMERLWDFQVTSVSLIADLFIIDSILGRIILESLGRKKM